jgi:hypothetical protein
VTSRDAWRPHGTRGALTGCVATSRDAVAPSRDAVALSRDVWCPLGTRGDLTGCRGRLTGCRGRLTGCRGGLTRRRGALTRRRGAHTGCVVASRDRVVPSLDSWRPRRCSGAYTVAREDHTGHCGDLYGTVWRSIRNLWRSYRTCGDHTDMCGTPYGIMWNPFRTPWGAMPIIEDACCDPLETLGTVRPLVGTLGGRMPWDSGSCREADVTACTQRRDTLNVG